MTKQTLKHISNDGVPIYCQIWQDESRPCRGLLQIVHGYAEWVDRYDEFATFMAQHGFLVFGEDHRGHGQTQQRKDRVIHFADKNGFELVVEDNHSLLNMVRKLHPGIPVFLFGHSMGSFLSRRYIQLYGNEFNGVILSGTGNNPLSVLKFGHSMAMLHIRLHGAQHPDVMLTGMMFGQLNASFRHSKTGLDWVCTRPEVVNAYYEDERRGKIASSGFIRDFTEGMIKVQTPALIEQVPKSLPVLFASGEEDPVGGKKAYGVYEAYTAMQTAGITDVSIKIYPGDRHEILNETNRAEVSQDILDWINEHM